MWRPRLFRIERVPRELRAALEDLAGFLFAIGVALLLFATLKGQLARAAELPRDVGAGTLLFQSADGSSFDPAAPLATDVRISVAGVVARVAINQRFRNTGTAWAEAVYALPLPDDAAVDTLKMTIGDRVIEGEIHERAEAEKIYGQARAAGQRASLVRQTSANLFTTAVANIGPGESIDITIEYLQTARYDAGEFSLRLPLTLTPRYGAGDTPEAQASASSTVLPELPLVAEPTAGSNVAGRKLRFTLWSHRVCRCKRSAGAATSCVPSDGRARTSTNWQRCRRASRWTAISSSPGGLWSVPPRPSRHSRRRVVTPPMRC